MRSIRTQKDRTLKHERTLVLVKPDGVRRGLIGEVVSRMERKGLLIAALRMFMFDDDLVAKHYEAHVDKPFYPGLKEFIMSGPVVALVVAGDEAISVVRTMMGVTNFAKAVPGTIRGDYAFSIQQNIVHGSDSVESAEREIALYFRPSDLFA